METPGGDGSQAWRMRCSVEVDQGNQGFDARGVFWGAENLSLMTLIVPTPITINLGTEKSTEKNGPGQRRTGAIGPPI